MTRKANLTTDANAIINTVSETVSQRIKQYRKRKEISLDELSRRAGVSKGALVGIEGYRANPNIVLLCYLATAMGVSVVDFVDVSFKPTVRPVAEDEIPGLWKDEKGGKARLLVGSGGPDTTEPWIREVQPGERLASPDHAEGTLELFYVQSSTFTLGVKNCLYRVETDCSAAVGTGVPHFYENQGESPLIFIVMVHEKAF